MGWLKVNLDGACDVSSGVGGVGVVFRNHDSLVIGGACLSLPHIVVPETVEAAAGELLVRWLLILVCLIRYLSLIVSNW